jgi:hypothetical protein
LEGIAPPRPLTHDLAVILLETLGATLTSIVVTEIRDHVFYAELNLDVAGSKKVISSRPSDAIALAVRTGSLIFASESLLDEAGQSPALEPADEEEAIIDEFRDFLDDLNPEDFRG